MVKSSLGFASPEQSPGFMLWQVSTIWQRQIKAILDPYGLSHSQFALLAVLLWCEENGNVPIQKFLVNKTKLDKMTVSAALKKLVSDAYIVRAEHSKDTRAKVITLTASGRKLVKNMVKNVEAVDNKFFNSLSRKEAREFIQSLRMLSRVPS